MHKHLLGLEASLDNNWTDETNWDDGDGFDGVMVTLIVLQTL